MAAPQRHDFNIGRCYDRLEQRQPAIEAYQRFLDGAPSSPGAPEVRVRIATLRARVPERPPAARPTARTYLGPIVLGASALAVAGVTAGLVGSVAGPFHSLEIGRCATYCDPTVYSGLQARATAGYALFGISGVLALEDVIWFGVVARKRK